MASRTAGQRDGKTVSPAARLCGFLILLGVVFAVAYVVGSRLGPLTTTHDQAPAHGRPMNMGARWNAGVPSNAGLPAGGRP